MGFFYNLVKIVVFLMTINYYGKVRFIRKCSVLQFAGLDRGMFLGRMADLVW